MTIFRNKKTKRLYTIEQVFVSFTSIRERFWARPWSPVIRIGVPESPILTNSLEDFEPAYSR